MCYLGYSTTSNSFTEISIQLPVVSFVIAIQAPGTKRLDWGQKTNKQQEKEKTVTCLKRERDRQEGIWASNLVPNLAPASSDIQGVNQEGWQLDDHRNPSSTF